MKIFTIIKDKSSRVPGKNFRLLNGKPLWTWLVGELKDHELYINTDSKRLIEDPLIEEFGANVINRSQEHIDWEEKSQTLGSPVESMLADFYSDFVIDLDEPVALVHVTSPFLRAETLTKASTFLKQGYGSVHSVKRIQDFCYVAQGEEDEPPEPVNFNPEIIQRTQDLRPVFQSLGAFFITNKRNWLETQTRLPSPTRFFELCYPENIEIDTEDEFLLAERCASWS